MSISERIKQITAQRVRTITQPGTEQKGKQQTLTEREKEALALCAESLHIFGIIDNLIEINETLLNGRGEISEQSRVDTRKNYIVVASASLFWETHKKGIALNLEVSVEKTVNSTKPFELTIKHSENEFGSVVHPQFSASFDNPREDQLSRDGDVPKWDIRGIDDLDNNLGYFVSREEFTEGIKDRMARACVYLIENGLI